jgi:hypothetical protein
MILLQAESLGVFETLSQYGALGVITLGLGSALWFMLKRQLQSEDALKNQVDTLQKEMTEYIRGDQQHLKTSIDNNTEALRDLKDIILEEASPKRVTTRARTTTRKK